MRRVLLFFALLLACHCAKAQFLWQRAVGTAADTETAVQMVTTTTGFVTVGRSLSVGPLFPPQGLYLSKVDFRGDTLWTKRVAFPGVEVLYAQDLIEDRAGNLVVSAVTFGPGAPPPANQGLLVKFTPTGDMLWTQILPASGSQQSSLTKLVLGNDGNYVVIGEVAEEPTLFKYDPAGALLWTQPVPYNATRAGYLQNLVAVPNGYLLISSPNGGANSKFIVVNEQGIYQSERPGSYYYPYQLRRDSQGNVLAVTGDLTKYSPLGDTIWSHTYYQFGQLLDLSRLVELPNGHYLAAGTRYNSLDNDIGFVLLDRNGVLLRDTLLVRYQSDESVAGVGLTPAGDYVVAGATNQGPIGEGDQLLFAYRSWARLLPTRPATIASGAPVRVLAYPNPTTDLLTLAASDGHPLTGTWQLLDLTGRLLQAGQLAGQATTNLHLGGRLAGLYLLRITELGQPDAYTLRLEKN